MSRTRGSLGGRKPGSEGRFPGRVMYRGTRLRKQFLLLAPEPRDWGLAERAKMGRERRGELVKKQTGIIYVFLSLIIAQGVPT